jgi:hypothetical protein
MLQNEIKIKQIANYTDRWLAAVLSKYKTMI